MSQQELEQIDTVEIDPNTKAHVRPMAAQVVFYGVNLAMVIITLVWSKSNFYLAFLFIPFLLQLLAFLSAVPYHDTWKKNEFDMFSEFSCDGTFQLCQRDGLGTLSRVVRWKVVRNVTWFIFIPVWIRALWLWGQVEGINIEGFSKPYTGLSSCNAATRIADVVYNPAGAFDGTNKFKEDQYYITCLFEDATWANPAPQPHNYVAGYQRLPSTQTLDCSTSPQPQAGFINIEQCLPISNSYPDPSQGVLNAREGSTTSSVRYCPGNMDNEVVCYDPTNTFLIPCTLASPTTARVSGKPRKLCPFCLNSWRQTSQLFNQPEGFDRCPAYSDTEGIGYTCMWCPGLRYGWLADEVATRADTVVVFWLVTIIVFMLLPLQAIVFCLMGNPPKVIGCLATYQDPPHPEKYAPLLQEYPVQ